MTFRDSESLASSSSLGSWPLDGIKGSISLFSSLLDEEDLDDDELLDDGSLGLVSGAGGLLPEDLLAASPFSRLLHLEGGPLLLTHQEKLTVLLSPTASIPNSCTS